MFGRKISIFVKTLILTSSVFTSQNLLAQKTSPKKQKLLKDKWEVVAIDAKYSYDKGDLYQSLRLLELLRDKKAEVFLKAKNLNTYLDNLYLLGSSKKLAKSCNEEFSLRKEAAAKVAYYCALTFYRHGAFRQAYQWINKVQKDEVNHQSKILSASILLALNNPEKCLKQMTEPETFGDVKDLAFLLKARCLMEYGNFVSAIDHFLKISPESVHYADALYDLSWAYFKSRQIGDSRSNIDIVLSSFNESDSNQKSIDSLEYFNLRFLKAYLGIVQTGASDVKSAMDLASQEIESLREKHKFDDSSLKTLVSTTISEKNIKQYSASLPGFGDWYSFVSTWGQLSFLNRAMKDYRHLKAVQIEAKRSVAPEYRKNLAILEAVLAKTSEWALFKLYKDSLQALDGFEFRVKLAKLKVDTLKKTKGAQNLKQAKEIYKRKENYVQSLTGELQ